MELRFVTGRLQRLARLLREAGDGRAPCEVREVVAEVLAVEVVQRGDRDPEVPGGRPDPAPDQRGHAERGRAPRPEPLVVLGEGSVVHQVADGVCFVEATGAGETDDGGHHHGPERERRRRPGGFGGGQ
jgi:hypothetical protein